MNNKNVEKRTSEIEFHVPRFEELSFRRRLYADKQTMNYGDKPFDFDEGKWPSWYDKWIKNPANRFYAYLKESETGEFVGDVNYHFDEKFGAYMIGIVILGSRRGEGFAQQGLRLLCQKAKADGIEKVCNLIPRDREGAVYIHKKLGFVECLEKGTEKDIFLEKML